jgi:phosphatidylinositol alpha-mannosyltransferase
MASGTPVLASHLGGVAEQVKRSGAGGLFAAGEPAALAGGAIDLLDADRDALGIWAREYAEREHDWCTVFDRLFSIYRDVLESGP